MALSIIDLNNEYYADPLKSQAIGLGSIFVGKPDTDPEIEANRLPIVARQENGTDIPIAVNQQPIMTGAGGIAQYQGANVQLLIEGSYSITVLRADNTQAYYVANAISGTPVDRADVIPRYPNIAALRANGVSADLTVWVDGHTTAEDGGQGIFLWISSAGGADDDGVTIQVASTSSGRYIRSVPQEFSVGFYGVKTDGSDNTSKFQAAVAAYVGSIFIPKGSYSVLTATFTGDKFHARGLVVITTNTTIRVDYLNKEWDVAGVYNTNDTVTYLGEFFSSLVDNNTANTPVAGIDDAFWHNTSRFPPFNNIRAYRSISNQSNIAVSFEIMQFNSTSIDNNNDFDETLFRLIPSVAGRYLMEFTLSWTALAVNDALDFQVRKNGTAVTSVRKISVSTSMASFTVTDMYEANGTTDYFELWIRNLASSTSDIIFGVADTYWNSNWLGDL